MPKHRENMKFHFRTLVDGKHYRFDISSSLKFRVRATLCNHIKVLGNNQLIGNQNWKIVTAFNITNTKKNSSYTTYFSNKVLFDAYIRGLWPQSWNKHFNQPPKTKSFHDANDDNVSIMTILGFQWWNQRGMPYEKLGIIGKPIAYIYIYIYMYIYIYIYMKLALLPYYIEWRWHTSHL